MQDNKRIVRVNVEVVYDDGTFEELKELPEQVANLYAPWATRGSRVVLCLRDERLDTVMLERK